MKTFRYVVLAMLVSVTLSMPAWAQGKGGGRGRGTHVAPAVQQDTPTTSPGTATTGPSAHRHNPPVAHRHYGHHVTPHAQSVSRTMPARSNKGGEVRGKARAEEVHAMNQEKHAAHKDKTASLAHGKAKGRGKK